MRRDLLKRIEALESRLNPIRLPPLTMIEVHRLPDDIRESYWMGDTAELDIPSYPDLPPGTVHTIIVDVGVASRDAWEQTRHLSDEDYERYDEARMREEDREPGSTVAKQLEPKFDQWGYRR